MNKETEKRNFFRINDIIGLSYTTLEDDEVFLPGGSVDMGTPLSDQLAGIDLEFNRVANTLWHENPTVARALGLLNRKISILDARSPQQKDQPVNFYEEMTVNISGCGMAFHCAKPLPVETRLKVSVVLKPSNIQLHFTGEIVGCEKVSASSTLPYWMRIRIDDDNPVAQEQLIQHIVQKQFAQIDAKNSGARP